MCATFAGTPSLSARRKSISRYARLWPPPWCRVVIRPCTFLPPREISGRTRDFSGSLRVTSEKSAPLAPRLPGVVGLYLRIAIVLKLLWIAPLADRTENVDPVRPGQADDGSLGVRPLAPAEPRPAPLARPVDCVDAGHPDSENCLDRLPDLGLVRTRRDDEGVLAVVGQPVALLRDDRPHQDVPRIGDLTHDWLSSCSVRSCSVRSCSVRSCSVRRDPVPARAT